MRNFCGTKCSVNKKDDSTSSVKPTLLEIGYSEEQIDEALEAIDEADYDKQERDCHFLD
jgi:Holliday junction resolvasome RuvABC DNA-binding subunit